MDPIHDALALASPRAVFIEDESVFRQLLQRTRQKRKGWRDVNAVPKLPSRLMNLGLAGFVDKTARLAFGW